MWNRWSSAWIFQNFLPFIRINIGFWKIFKDSKEIGKITSAVYSPRLKKNIALAMVAIDKSEVGTEFDVEVLSKKVNAVVVEKPFYDPKKKIASS